MKNSNEIKKALFNIGYGLYVITSRNAYKDNGLIVNSVMQITDNPTRIAVTINKKNYSHEIISETEIMNINCLSVDAPMSVFENFGFQSGKLSDKFRYITFSRSKNGLAVLSDYINSFISLKVEQYLDFDTHGMFICSVTDAETINNNKSMTYSYYHENVKPKPKKTNKKGYICKICGYIHEGELPDDFICPLCKHGVADFEPINIKEEKEMKKYVCDACGWVYDEELGAPDLGIAPGTKFEDLPEDFACPLCGVGKDMFSEE